MLEAKTELRMELASMINQKVVSLETRMEANINEVRQGTTSLLEELKTTVAAVRESQEKMGQALERMSNEVQELVQRMRRKQIRGQREPIGMKIYQLLALHPRGINLSFPHLPPGLLEFQKKRKKPV